MVDSLIATRLGRTMIAVDEQPTTEASAVVVGVGDGLGGAVARRFAVGGLKTVLVARNEARLTRLAKRIAEQGGRAVIHAADVRDEAAVYALFEHVEACHGPVDVAVFNAGAQHRQDFTDIGAEMFEKVWRLGCYAGFLVGQAAVKCMLPRGRGTIIFTGATASLRGGAEFAAFAAAKAGLRSVAQSMARAFGPEGIHVCHVVIDGVIDTPVIRERFPGLADRLPEDGMLSPDAVAETYFQLYRQHRSAWSFEVDVRPWAEHF